MSNQSLNPYAVSQTVEVVPEPASVQDSWKAIAVRWEKMRILYNMVVGAFGMLSFFLAALGGEPMVLLLVGAVVYGLAANFCYLLGPLTDMYLNWLVDLGERKYVPGFVVQFVRGGNLRRFLWLAGTIGSILLTLMLGMAAAIKFPAP